jgi:SAM-dependent methyltransferase
MSALPERDHARVTYDSFADHYDLFTAHHDYDHWTSTIERLARDHGLRGTRLLDVACGTGKSLLPFANRGYTVTACDISASMLAQAARKVSDDVHLAVHDMRALPLLGTFDLVCCIDDAVNYLMSGDELVAALEGMRRNLADDGVIVFDVNTVRSYRTFYGSLTVVPSDDRVVVWHGRAPATFGEGEVARAATELLDRRPDGSWRREITVHHQRHFARDTVEGAIADAGLACVGVYGMQLDGSTVEGFGEHDNSKALYFVRHRGHEDASA